MGLRASLCWLLSLAAFVFSTATSAGEPPRNLLADAPQWQVQGGAWKVDTANGTAAVTAGETVAELASTHGVALLGRWVSLKVVLTGDAAKAGVWFSGLRDEKDQTMRIVFDAAAGEINNGRGKTLAALPAGAFREPVEVILTFAADTIRIEHGGAKVAEFAVKFAEQEPTPSLFVERGTAEFREMILSGEAVAAAAKPMPAKVAPKVPVPAVEAAAPGLVVDFTGAGMLPLKSGWNDYFGVHFETAKGPWKTIRQYDGPSFGMPLSDRHAADVKSFDGPFAKMEVQTALGDFGDWQRKDAKRLDSHLSTLIEEDRTAVFISPWVQPFDFVQQDQVWALMKALYGGSVGAEGRVLFQWGDDINSRHLGASLYSKVRYSKVRGSVSGRGANKEDDIRAYVEHYFAPAVEAVRLASEEIYHDPARIPVLTGSCSRAADKDNREWFTRMLETTIEGSLAQSLKGRKVIEIADIITVDYPFYKTADASALQELWDRFGARVKGLWVTEEYGSSGKGPADILRTAALYLDWVARNQLDAKQTRLLWNLPEEKRDKYSVRGVVRALGETCTGPLRTGMQQAGDSVIYRIAAGETRMLIVNVPPESKKGKKPDDIREITLTVTNAQAAKPWLARFLSAKDRKAPDGGTILGVAKNGASLVVKIDASPRDEWAVVLEAQ